MGQQNVQAKKNIFSKFVVSSVVYFVVFFVITRFCKEILVGLIYFLVIYYKAREYK